MEDLVLAAFYAVLIGSSLFAWIKGGWPERAGAALIVLMVLIRAVTLPFVSAKYQTIDVQAVFQDLISLVGFVAIAIRARRFWPICAAALQLLTLGAHFARQVLPQIDLWTYALMKTGPTFLVLLTLVGGTMCFCRRKRLAGSPG